jgi:NAD+ diphosphatase
MSSPRVWYLVHPKGVVVRREGERVVLPTEDDAVALGVGGSQVHELAVVDGMSAVAAAIAEAPPAPFEVARPFELVGPIGEKRFMMAGIATQIVEWAETHRFCGRCATPTERVPTERCMKCPACGLMAYPRIAPAVIVLVRRGNEALLARGARVPYGFYSTLAGFVEPGESLEETIAREVREEVGLEVAAPTYFGSQPWPFPHSLMVGFVAEYAGGEIRADGAEILDARWFRTDDLPAIPPRVSIARHLIDAWVADVAGAAAGDQSS